MINLASSDTIVLPADQPAAFSYRRVSDPKQAASGLGEEAQLKSNTDYFNSHLAPAGFVWGGDFVDSAVSARAKHFLKRKAGDRLNITARHGDCIIIAKFDRAFRSIQDFANTTANWNARGIGFAIVALGWQTWGEARSIYDKALLGMSAVFAELESDLISARTKDGMDAKRARGEPLNQHVPPGKTRFGNRLIDNHYERQVCREIVRFRDLGYSANQIFCHFRQHGIRRSGNREWTERMIYSAEKWERRRMHEAAIAKS